MDKIANSTSVFSWWVSSATSAINSVLGTSLSERTVVGGTVALGALYALYSSGGEEGTKCLSDDVQMAKLWTGRFQKILDEKSDTLVSYNEKAQKAYENALSKDEMLQAFEADRSAYVDFCRVNGAFDKLKRRFASEADQKHSSWLSCQLEEQGQKIRKTCYTAFDSLRSAWTKIYASRLYNEEAYFASAAAWLKGKIWKERPRDLLRSIPERILDSGFDGEDVYQAMNVLSYVQPFERDGYCKKGCPYVRGLYRDVMKRAHPDKLPFPDVSKKEALRLSQETAVLVNRAREVLRDKKTKKSLCI